MSCSFVFHIISFNITYTYIYILYAPMYIYYSILIFLFVTKIKRLEKRSKYKRLTLNNIFSYTFYINI